MRVLWLLIATATIAAPPLSERPPTALAAGTSEGERARQAFAAGHAASRAGDFSKARDAFAQACALAPDWALAALEHGLAALAANAEDVRGVTSLERAVALDPKNPRAHFQLGAAYAKRRRQEDAVRELRAALALRNDMLEARYELAGALAELGRKEQAIFEFLDVLAREPGHLGALSALADLYEGTGQKAEAELALVTITRMHPTVPYHFYRLAQFYDRIGDADKAQDAYAAVERLDPRQRNMRRLK